MGDKEDGRKNNLFFNAPPGKNPPIKGNLKIKLNDMRSMECPECHSTEFITVYVLKEVPSVVSRTGRVEIQPVEFFKCAECGHLTSIIKLK